MSTPAVALLRISGLLLAAGIIAAAEPQRPAPDATQVLLEQARLWQQQLLAMPRTAGFALFLAAGLPLFFGWTLVRMCSAATMAAAAGLVLWQVLAPQVTSAVLWGSVAVAALLAGVVGWFLYQILLALRGAALIGLLFFSLAQQLMPAALGQPWPQVVLGASAIAGATMGAVIGWRLAPWVAIIETTLIGTLLMASGIIALAKPGGDSQTLLVIGLTALAAVPAGLIVQARREANRGT